MQLCKNLSEYHSLMSESKHLSAGHEVCKHREFITIYKLTVIFVKNVLGTISFRGSRFVKASSWRIWSWITLYLWQINISNTTVVFLFYWFCLGLREKKCNGSQWHHIIKMGHLHTSSLQVVIPDVFRKFYLCFSSVFPCHICTVPLQKR